MARPQLAKAGHSSQPLIKGLNQFAFLTPPPISPAMFEFSLPTKATSVPSGLDWLHEIKFDGYRLRLERDGDRVRLITRGGYNWASAIRGSWRRR
jgi:ATP-dependent DNA ligase